MGSLRAHAYTSFRHVDHRPTGAHVHQHEVPGYAADGMRSSDFAPSMRGERVSRLLSHGFAFACACVLFACTGNIKNNEPNDAYAGSGGTSGYAGTGAMSICTPGAPGCVTPPTGCGAGLLLCNSVCVNTAIDSANCGQCGVTCPSGMSCQASQCSCAPGMMPCNGVCVSLQSDAANCGVCGNPCQANQICDAGQCVVSSSPTCTQACGGNHVCVAGTCSCPVDTTECSDGCVDTHTSSTDCGSCDHACPATATCQQGQCACPAGLTLCGDQCVDTQTSQIACGSCDQACADSEVCTSGHCQGPLAADGCSGQAQGISISQIAVYQSVKIPIMNAQAEIAPNARIADVVNARTTMLRVFVAPQAGFGSRQLSARLTLDHSGSTDQYYAKLTVAGASSDASSGSTFNIQVPADKVDETTRYSVELVECGGTPTGTAGAARFPSTGNADLGAVATGPLKIMIVPVSANSQLPDTSDAALQRYKTYLMAMYPVREVQIGVATQITTSYPLDWVNMLTQIANKRQTDKPARDVYYYGFVKPSTDNTVESYVSTHCAGGCTAGIGYVGSPNAPNTRAAIGLAFNDETSASTMAHEVGHNHGREHAPCAPNGSQIDQVDTHYPYAGALIGVWGYDSRSQTLIDPTKSTDIMGYCSRKWISDYTYQGIVDHVIAVNASPLIISARDSAAVAYRQLLIESGTSRWSKLPAPDEPSGEPEPADVLAQDGHLITTTTVLRTPIGDIDAASILVPEPQAGWFAIRVKGGSAIAFE